MEFTREQIDYVAHLARIALTDEEREQFGAQLASVLAYMDKLNELDTTDVEPLAHCLPIHNVFREDVVKESLTNDEALANAPQRDGEFFAVPKVLDDASA